jgi:hypothetical protein
VKIFSFTENVWTFEDIIRGDNIQGWFGASIEFVNGNNVFRVGVVNTPGSNSLLESSLDCMYTYKKISNKWIQHQVDNELSTVGELLTG